jgi:hypothetical protein
MTVFRKQENRIKNSSRFEWGTKDRLYKGPLDPLKVQPRLDGVGRFAVEIQED